MEKKKTAVVVGSPRARSCTRPWRWAKTLFFLATMVASLLLVCAPPLLVVLLDLLLPPALLSNSSLSASSLCEQLESFVFRSSLVDVPIVSAVRSFLILCAFLVCDGSRGVYLGITVFCSSLSMAYVLLKAFSMYSVVGAPRPILAIASRKDAAVIQALFLGSLALAIAHIAVAYRTSCRERRKLLVYRIDVEAVCFPFPFSRAVLGPAITKVLDLYRIDHACFGNYRSL
ncbi:hydrolase, alpha beta fold family protein [Musa troglodytarum]|uniref:Hydrolase, alpha beta fold family protein n=1 Tax=Musa troglodytarum TaxID=320322 RepID=A0A9E7FSN9_9LILI|nr:hydrolase, alpha beta fold family protein [Musa troglodytarum]